MNFRTNQNSSLANHRPFHGELKYSLNI